MDSKWLLAPTWRTTKMAAGRFGSRFLTTVRNAPNPPRGPPGHVAKDGTILYLAGDEACRSLGSPEGACAVSVDPYPVASSVRRAQRRFDGESHVAHQFERPGLFGADMVLQLAEDLQHLDQGEPHDRFQIAVID